MLMIAVLTVGSLFAFFAYLVFSVFFIGTAFGALALSTHFLLLFLQTVLKLYISFRVLLGKQKFKRNFVLCPCRFTRECSSKNILENYLSYKFCFQ